MTDKFNPDPNHLGNPSKFDPINTNYFEEMNLTAENKFIYFTSNQEIQTKDLYFLEKKRFRSEEMLSETETEDTKLIQAIKEVFWIDPIIEPDEDEIIYLNQKKDDQNIPVSYALRKEKEKEEKPNENMRPVPEKIFVLEKNIELKEINEDKLTDKKRRKSPIKNKKKFNTKTNHTPGRKTKSNKKEGEYIKKPHDKKSFDNIITKVQVHFITFLINFSNDVIKEESGKDIDLLFKDIDYKTKRNVKSENLESFKRSKVEDILKNPVSKKFRSINENHNKEIYQQVVNISEIIKDYFNMNFVEIFEKYFNNCNLVSKITISGKDINLSKATKCFYDLINKNRMIQDQLIDYARRVYLNKRGPIENNNNSQKKFYIN